MKLFYCDVPFGNFGDDLNTYLWPRLMPGAFHGTVRFWPKEARVVERDDAQDTLFVGIGTLLNNKVPSGGRKLVFGSGAGRDDLPEIDRQWEFHCVRGPLTARALGLPAEMAIADPAILVRLLPPAAAGPVYRTSFMPHWCQAQSGAWQKICTAIGIQFIDPRWPPYRVLKAIAQSRLLISEALHGAIIADALRVPWVAVSSKHHIQDFKWRDWCQSLGVEYEPVSIAPIWTPRAGVVGKAITTAKMVHGAMVLTGLNHLERLSSDRVIERATDRLVGSLETFAKTRDLALELSPQY